MERPFTFLTDLFLSIFLLFSLLTIPFTSHRACISFIYSHALIHFLSMCHLYSSIIPGNPEFSWIPFFIYYHYLHGL
jgi:hypothetical protein